MAKGPTIVDVADVPNNASSINNNLNNLSTAFDNTLSLDGSTPNSMNADLDMNSNDILNVGTLNGVDTSVLTTNIDALVNAAALSDTYFLGPKAADPTLDNDGNALIEGALYYNTATDDVKVYDGAAWGVAYANLSSALLVANNLSDLTNIPDARNNLALGSMATQEKGAVSITGGTIVGITPLAATEGGTGGATAAAGFDNIKQAATTTSSGVVEKSTSGENIAGTSDVVYPTVAGTKEILDTFASPAPIWVNFDGKTGGVATIIGSNGVSSITRNGTGDYTLNFTTPFANTNYAVVATSVSFDTGNASMNVNVYGDITSGYSGKSTTQLRIIVAGSDGFKRDSSGINVHCIS